MGHRGESGSVGRKEAGSGLGRGEQERLPLRFVSFPESPQWGSAAFCREELRPGLVGALLRTLPLAVSLAGPHLLAPPLSAVEPLLVDHLTSGHKQLHTQDHLRRICGACSEDQGRPGSSWTCCCSHRTSQEVRLRTI